MTKLDKHKCMNCGKIVSGEETSLAINWVTIFMIEDTDDNEETIGYKIIKRPICDECRKKEDIQDNHINGGK